ncbi:MAG: phage DNA encapsidation protein [Bacilli bacterium]|nr:phage DNA encapsidation protein [Bacilli bacterium]
MWYTINRVLTYNAMLNFIIGERGVGKSYSLKKHVIKRFLKKNRKFIYLRRYETELEKSLKDNEFFKDICKDPDFKDIKLKAKGDKFLVNDKVAGYAIPLSKSTIFKSVPFPDVDIIIFDEFLIDPSTCYHYMKNEPEKVLDFMETVGRLRDIQVFLLGNSISIVNPYFDYFNISLPYNSDIKTFKEGLILINYIKNEVYREAKKQTKFGKLTEGTKYSSYAIDNKFLLDNNNFIRKKSPNSKFFFTLILNKVKYGIWIDYDEFTMYVSTKYNDNRPIQLTFNYEDHTEKSILIKSRSVFFQNIISHYDTGKLFFENQTIKSEITKLIHRTHR